MKSVAPAKSHHSFWKGKPYLKDLSDLVVNKQTNNKKKTPNKQTKQKKSKKAFQLTENLVFLKASNKVTQSCSKKLRCQRVRGKVVT